MDVARNYNPPTSPSHRDCAKMVRTTTAHYVPIKPRTDAPALARTPAA